jgi:tetratricopeptide (TPR) repeat protein
VAYDPSGEAQAARARTSLETMRHEAERIRTALRADHEDEQEAVLEWAQDLANQFAGATLPMEVLRETETAFHQAAGDSLGERVQKALARAVKLEQEGNVRAALGAFQAVLGMSSGHDDATAGRARASERISQGEQRAREAVVQLERGDPEAARETAEEALSLLPDQPAAAATLAEARAAASEIERLTRTFQPDLESAAAEAQLGRFERLRDRYPGSQVCVRTLAQAKELMASAHQEREAANIAAAISDAESALAAGRLAHAEAAAESLIATPKGKERATALLGQIRERRARADDLARQAREATDAGRQGDALRLYREAQKENPEIPGAAEGAAAAEAAIARMQAEIDTAVSAAEAAAAAGPRGALAAWQRVLEVSPDHERAGAESDRLAQALGAATQCSATRMDWPTPSPAPRPRRRS